MANPVNEENYDIEAVIKNCRKSKKSFYSGYGLPFGIQKSSATTGIIDFVDKTIVEYNEEAIALVRFLMPEAYPKSIWTGRKILIKEGSQVIGYAIVTKILNKILESDEIGIEGELNLEE